MKGMIRTTLIIIMVICTTHFFCKGEGTQLKTAGELRIELAATNARIEQLYITEKVNSLTSLYTGQLTFFPEYKPAIFETMKLTAFFKDWFKAGDIKAYQKNIYAVEVYSDHVVEIGTFSMNYSSVHNPNGEYKGKYMVVWKRDKQGKLSIVSETFGSDKWIEAEAVPYADVQVEENDFVPKHTVSNQLLLQVKEFDEVLLKAVAEGDGDVRAKGFTEDAILMGNFDSMRVGMASIRPKMLGTYKPGNSYIVKHTYSRIIDLGEYILVNGHYKGGPADPKNGGAFEGKMSNLLKKDKDGKLLMYRQIGNRDKKQI